MIQNKRILLTGGAGFIGTSLARRLVDGNDVVVLDNCHRNSLKDSGLLPHPRITMIEGDVLDADSVRSAMRGCQMVVHLAAIAGVDTVLKMPVTTMKVNIIGTYNVLEAAVEAQGIERLIDFSTSEVFGSYAYKVREGDITALGAVGEARWTYAVSKLATEHMAHNYFKQFGLPALSIRPFNIYGPGQVGEGAIHRFIVQALWLRITGPLAWWFWLLVHIMYLAGFRNRISVLLEWAYAYITYERGVRLIPEPIERTTPDGARERETVLAQRW